MASRAFSRPTSSDRRSISVEVGDPDLPRPLKPLDAVHDGILPMLVFTPLGTPSKNHRTPEGAGHSIDAVVVDAAAADSPNTSTKDA